MRRPWQALLLAAGMLCVQGCGFGWLYMKIGDSKRIAGVKMLSYDTRSNRFQVAQKAFLSAISYYKDAILYDDVTNPSVYHKLGFCYMMLSPGDRLELWEIRSDTFKSFLSGLDTIRKLADQRKKTPAIVALEQEVRTELQLTEDVLGTTKFDENKEEGGTNDSAFTDEDYARCHAGLGQMAFLDAISQRSEKNYKVALFHFKLAERASKRRRKAESGGKTFLDSVMDFFNLQEIFEDIPYVVEVAKIHNYLGLAYRKRGETKLQNYHFQLARENLDQALEQFPNDVRVLSERARLSFYQGEFEKALSDIEKVVRETEFYADKREFMLLMGEIYNEMGRYDDALQAFQWILDREEFAQEPLIGRARAFAAKKDRNSASADLATLMKGEEKNPFLFRQAGDTYAILGDRRTAAEMYLKAYYLDQEDIELVFLLGKLYLELNETQQGKDLLNKVVQINPTSDFAAKAKQLLGSR